MPEWRKMTLAEMCAENGGSIQTGPFGSQLHASDYVPDGIPSVMPQDIGDNRILENKIARITPADADRLSRHRLRDGDIVYSRRGDVERRALVRPENNDWLCGTGCLRVRVRVGDGSAFDASYVSYALGTAWTRAWITRHAVGATMLNLNTSILGAVPLNVPDVASQRAIAGVLGALDDKIAANTALVNVSEALALTVIQRATSHVTLTAVARHRTEMVQPSAFPASVEHFSLPAFDAGVMAQTSASGAIKSGKFLLRGPSVLFSKLNPRIPRIWDVREVSPGSDFASTEFVVLEPLECSTTTLWAAVSQPEFVTRVQEKVSGTTGSHQRVNPAGVLATEVLDPRTLNEADAAVIDATGAVVASTRLESARLAATRDELLPLLMSGRLTVREAARTVEAAT